MTPDEIKNRISEKDFRFLTSRSSGPGGQNVNKVSTRVEVRFDLLRTNSLSEDEKALIRTRLAGRITDSGELVVRSQSERTQARNRERAVERLYVLLAGALSVSPERIGTLPTAQSRKKRLEGKRKIGLQKKLRKSRGLETDEQ